MANKIALSLSLSSLALSALVSVGYLSSTPAEAQPTLKQFPITPSHQAHVIPFNTCTGMAPVKVLAVENQFGPDGEGIPTRIDYQVNGGAYYPAFGGNDVSAGQVHYLPLGGTWESPAVLGLKGKMAHPDFDLPDMTEEHPSTNPVSVIMLKRNDDLAAVLASKNIEAPYQDQRSITQILSPYLDHTGRINIPARHVIYLYEFGLGAPQTESIDYNDLVTLVSYNCHEPQDVLLRNSIGPNHYTTNGNKPFSTTFVSPPGSIVPIQLQNNETVPVTLSKIRGIYSFFSGIYHDFEQFDYYIRVWTDFDAVLASPGQGNVYNSPAIDVPDQGPTQFGTTGWFAPGGEKPTYDLSFDLSGMDIVILPGQSLVVGVHAHSFNGGMGGGSLGIIESTESGESDRIFQSDTWLYIVSGAFAQHDGRVAYEVHGRK